MAPTIAFFNQFFERWPEADELGEAGIRPLFGVAASRDADAVVFHLPTLPVDFFRHHSKPAGQIWVAWCLESRTTCAALAEERSRQRFDLFMTHERSADIWVPYFGPWSAGDLLRPPAAAKQRVPVVHLQSNPYDDCGRNRYVFELMRKIQVDSCGKVLRTCDCNVGPGWPGRTALMGRYKFTLAMENSISQDYVTDKFYDPLRVGSVPVYRGVKDVRELAPHPDSYIDAADFDAPEDLARHLLELDRDDAAYARFHAWRLEGFSAEFRALLERLQKPTFVRLAEAVAARSRGSAIAMPNSDVG